MEALARQGVEVVVEGAALGALADVAVVGEPRTRLRLSFTVDDFGRAVEELDVSAASLWPERPAKVRAVQLMLVHIDEDLATRTQGAAETVMTLHPGGQARIRPA